MWIEIGKGVDANGVEKVAPRVEAWIEIPFAKKVCIEIYVASHVEVRIEMKVARNIN